MKLVKKLPKSLVQTPVHAKAKVETNYMTLSANHLIYLYCRGVLVTKQSTVWNTWWCASTNHWDFIHLRSGNLCMIYKSYT